MGNRVHNLLFLILFSGILCVAPVGKLLAFAGLEFPSWTGVGEQKSLLEGREYADFPDLSVQSVKDGVFQDGFEQFLSDAIPLRDDAVMLNAAVQRCGISVSAALFGCQVYPTFYGSDYVYDSETDRLWPILRKATDEEAEELRDAATVFSTFRQRHPDAEMVFYQVDRSLTSSLNPTRALMGPAVDTRFLTEHFYGNLSFDVLDGTCSTSEQYDDAYFKTDHHWTIDEAYRCYCRVLSYFSPDAAPMELPEKVEWDVPFYGAVSRLSLCLTREPDYIADYPVAIDGVDVLIDGEKVDSSALADYQLYHDGDADDALYTNRYAEYFHTDYGIIELCNDHVADGTLLIIADSYSNNMERFFTANYRHVYVVDPRHANVSMDEFMDEHTIDNVLFLMGSTTLVSEPVLDSLNACG